MRCSAATWASRISRAWFGGTTVGPRLLALLIPIVIYLLGTDYLHRRSTNDPTSKFFDKKVAYRRRYSEVRIAEADHFIEKYNSSTTTATFKSETPWGSAEPPFICVGLVTIVRPSGAIYVRRALASMLDGLSQKERNQIHIAPLIGHINATEHPIYAEPWLARVADRILTYQDSEMPVEMQNHIQEIEKERKRTGVPDREKTLIDYSHVMKVCERTRAPYILMLEDDVLFMDGWFHRTRAALRRVESQTEKDPNGWFYLRLFYVTHMAGSTHWQKSDMWYFHLTAVCILLLVLLTPRCIRTRPVWAAEAAQKAYQNIGLISITGVLSYGVVTWLFFAAGKFTTVGEFHGVRRMADGCCTQAMVWPRNRVEPLTAWYAEKKFGFVDSLAEELAGTKPEVVGSRWAIGPVVAQHVGGKSSKGDNWGSDKPGQMSASQTLWNFMFESNDAQRLAREHLAAAERFEQERVMGDE